MDDAKTHLRPRVLIILLTKVKCDDQSNLLIRKIFRNWPKDRLAQIYSGEIIGTGEFFGSYYRITPEDRRLGKLFFRAKGLALPTNQLSSEVKRSALTRDLGIGRKLKAILQRWMINSGLWEYVFRISPSRRMLSFVENFAPDIIYCQGYSYGFSELAQVIHMKFNLPIWFQTTDDWPHVLYRHSPMRWLVRRSAKRLITKSAIRYAFGHKMLREYETRYRLPFDVSYHLDGACDISVRETRQKDVYNFVYIGSLGHRRDEAIIDLLKALQFFPEKTKRFHIQLYSNNIPVYIEDAARHNDMFVLHKLPSHEEVQKILRSADCLYLPESHEEAKECIEFSISTKAHLYMRAQIPILVYGPTHSGMVNYAEGEGWATVVKERDTRVLVAAIKKILNEPDSVRKQLQHARKCLNTYHNEDAFELNLMRRLNDVLENARKSREKTKEITKI